MSATRAFLLIALLLTASAFGPLFRGGAGTGGGVAIPLTRNFNQPSGTTTPASAFWMIGQPFRSATQAGGTADIPSGDIVTATLGGTSVRVAMCNQGGPLLHADSSTRWMRLLVDFSGVTITPGSADTLQFTAVSGSWPSTSGRSAADFEALNDTVTLANISGATAGSIAGTYTANFAATGSSGATGSIYQTTPICTTPLGNLYEVKANFYNGTTAFATTCSCTAVPTAAMYYWVTQTSGGALGPIASWGPYIENLQGLSTTGLQRFTADVTFLRNAVQVRQQLGLPIYGLTSAVMMRADGQADWTADDPAINVTQDYTKVRATRTIPPYATGITYTGGTSTGSAPGFSSFPISAVSGATFTTSQASWAGLTYTTYRAASAVLFTGSLGGLTGISLNTQYWACFPTGTTAKLYDTYAHAQAGWSTGGGPSCGATGLITPGGTYTSGLTVVSAVGPDTSEVWDPAQGDTSARPDLEWSSEWGAAYVVGNTAAWQLLARVQSYAIWGAPVWLLNSATGCVPSVQDVGDTPATGTNCAGGTGLGTAAPTTAVIGAGAGYSSNINGGVGPAGQSGIVWALDDAHWFGNVAYVVELLEGTPYLQDQLMQDGNFALYTFNVGNGAGQRNQQVQGLGTVYHGAIFASCYSAVIRRCAWQSRGLSQAMWFAPQGSAEQTYFTSAVANSASEALAYWAYEGWTWDIPQTDDNTGTTTINNGIAGPYISGFMYSYNLLVHSMDAALNAEFNSNLTTVANDIAQLALQRLDAPCVFWADTWSTGAFTTDMSAGGPPVSQLSTFSRVGVEQGSGGTATFSYNAANGQITDSNGGWAGMNGFSANFAVGDMFRPQNWNQDSTPVNAAPSPLVDGDLYCVASVVGTGVFTVFSTPGGACSGGTVSSFGASVTGGGGYMVPAAQSCFATGTQYSVPNNPDSYLMYLLSGVGVAAANGTSGAATAFNNGAARLSGSVASISGPEAGWSMQTSW